MTMKFAVVEYNSKTGDIWRHTESRPNFLADPIREIDPTSFGCYVSALRGEHIPLAGLIVGSLSGASRLTIAYRQIIKRLTGSWPKRYSLEYLARFDAIMLVHQLSDAHELARAATRLRALYPKLTIIGVPTQPFGILRQKLESDHQARADFSTYLNACHVFISVVKATVPWYQKLTKTPVVYVPQPYPVAYASHHGKQRTIKDQTIIVAGVTQRDNIKLGQTVARLIQEQVPSIEILVPKVPDLALDTHNLGRARHRIIPFEEWQEHLDTLSRASLVINTDFTMTRGRVQVDCAAVGTPSLGSNSDGQQDLWPALAADTTTPIDSLVEHAVHLLRHPDAYTKAVQFARERLAKYDYEHAAARLEILVKTYGPQPS